MVADLAKYLLTIGHLHNLMCVSCTAFCFAFRFLFTEATAVCWESLKNTNGDSMEATR